MTFADVLVKYFFSSGQGWNVIGLFVCLMLSGMGSAKALYISGNQAAGALSEKPDLFGRLFVLMALPATQGLYGFVLCFLGMQQMGLSSGATLTVQAGLALCVAFILIGVVLYSSAIYQGKSSAAAINLTVKQPEKSGSALLFPALVETYSLLAFVGGFLLLTFIQGSSIF